MSRVIRNVIYVLSGGVTFSGGEMSKLVVPFVFTGGAVRFVKDSEAIMVSKCCCLILNT